MENIWNHSVQISSVSMVSPSSSLERVASERCPTSKGRASQNSGASLPRATRAHLPCVVLIGEPPHQLAVLPSSFQPPHPLPGSHTRERAGAMGSEKLLRVPPVGEQAPRARPMETASALQGAGDQPAPGSSYLWLVLPRSFSSESEKREQKAWRGDSGGSSKRLRQRPG